MKTFNNILAILAVLAIVALSAFNVHKVGEQAKEIAELQQYHQCEFVDTTHLDLNTVWESVDAYIEFRNEEIRWHRIVDVWENMPEISLRHILQHHGLHLGRDQIVEIYESNIEYYKAYEDGYIQAKTPDSSPTPTIPDKPLSNDSDSIQ